MIIGIDFGSTLTKIVLMNDFEVIDTKTIKRDESFTEAIEQYDLALVDKIMITGTGASYIEGNISGISTECIDEFRSAAVGSYYISGLDECLVVSLGTGTSFTYVNREKAEHAGGCGIGGALLASLAEIGMGNTDIGELITLADKGSLENADLLIKDISKVPVDNLTGNITVANMAKLSKDSTEADIAYGICNMVFQNVGVMAVMAARPYMTEHIVVMGTLAQNQIAKDTFEAVGNLFGYKFIVPEKVSYGVAIGAALNGLPKYMNAYSVYEKDSDDITYQFE